MWRDTHGSMLFFFVPKRSDGLQTDAMHMVRCDVARCIWSDAVLFVPKRSDGLQTDAVHMVRCGAMHMVSDAMHMVRCDVARCIWSDVMRVLSLGQVWLDAVLVCAKKISMNLYVASVHVTRCDVHGPMRCMWSDAMHMVRCCSCLHKTISRIIMPSSYQTIAQFRDHLIEYDSYAPMWSLNCANFCFRHTGSDSE